MQSRDWMFSDILVKGKICGYRYKKYMYFMECSHTKGF